MSDPQSVQLDPAPPARSRRRWLRLVPVFVILLLLLGGPWWTLLSAGTRWPPLVVVLGTLAFAAAFVGLPAMMVLGHGRRHLDWAAVTGDALLGAIWVLFVWSALAQLLRLGLLVSGVDDPDRSRIVAAAVVGVVVVLLGWGYAEAMRVPRTRRVDVTIPRLGPGLDGLRVVLITDTHYGPIDRTRWSAAVTDRRQRARRRHRLPRRRYRGRDRAACGRFRRMPLAAVRAKLARVYVTGNHEYIYEAQEWLDYMQGIGWEALHNRHVVVERGGDKLIVAGVDDATAKGSGDVGHGANLAAALDGAYPDGAGAAARAPTQTDHTSGRGRRRPAGLRAYARRADLAVQLPGPTRSAGGTRVEQARRTHAALHQPRRRLLGPAVPGVRPERAHGVDAPRSVMQRRKPIDHPG